MAGNGSSVTMASSPSRNLWLRRQQCPCGDWKCYVTYEGDAEDPFSPSQSVKNDAFSDEIFPPYVGMVFKTDDDAFEYYGNFARKNGFSIRKERSRLSPQLGVYKRDFVCYRSGFAPPRKKLSVENHRDRKSARCGCDAKMYLSKELVDGISQWFVVQFSNIHNHELLEDDQVRLLPAYRKIQEVDQERIILLSKAGFPIHRIVKILELEKGIHGGQLPFLQRDVRNFIQNRKKVVQDNNTLLAERRENDTIELLEACKAMKEANGEFAYDYAVDDNEKVKCIAWSCENSMLSDSIFTDVVCFETSYQSITYDIILGALLGIDNNGRIILFSCALLQDETTRSFSWALQAFLRFMKGKHPCTILTNLDPRLRDAVRCELPNTKHVVPTWIILPNLTSWFSHPLGQSYTEFRSNFDALMNIENSEEFEFQWNQMIVRFGLGSDKHVALLFSLRASWVLAYTRGHFLATMATKYYLKSVDTFLKEIFSQQTCLRSFFEQVSHTASLQNHRHQEILFMPMKTCIPIEEQARNILTPFAFNAFQNEIALAMQYAATETANGSCLVQHFKKTDGECLVVWIPDGEQIHCSCKGFESSGFLCRHAIRVLIAKNCFQIPEIYFPRRWQQMQYNDQSGHSNENGWLHEFHNLTLSLLAESSVSKGRSDYVGRELRRVLEVVRSFPTGDGIAMDITHSPAD